MPKTFLSNYILRDFGPMGGYFVYLSASSHYRDSTEILFSTTLNAVSLPVDAYAFKHPAIIAEVHRYIRSVLQLVNTALYSRWKSVREITATSSSLSSLSRRHSRVPELHKHHLAANSTNLCLGTTILRLYVSAFITVLNHRKVLREVKYLWAQFSPIERISLTANMYLSSGRY